MESKFHSFIVSDIHLADAEPIHRKNPYWKLFKRKEKFIDGEFNSFIEFLLRQKCEIPSELILNGDIFDFDSVLVIPDYLRAECSWLEKTRGMRAEEEKSLFKIRTILADHPVWVGALKKFLENGNRIVFVIGNHDIELHWKSVQTEILYVLGDASKNQVRFCEWFYVSGDDSLIEHGNQYDPYCLSQDPVHPWIRLGRKIIVRLPFGNQAGKIILNGMGLFNPHVDGSFIKTSAWEYVRFFYTYVLVTQPLLMFSWLWSALATAVTSVVEGLLPPVRDPLLVEERVEQIAKKAQAAPRVARSLLLLHAHPAVFNPFQILRELWLDRALMFVGIVWISWELIAVVRIIFSVSVLWWFLPLTLLTPLLIFYARGVESQLEKNQKKALKVLPAISRVTGLKRVIHGHTHQEGHLWVQGIEYLNTGTWSPAYEDVECTKPFGRKCFAWIKPDAHGGTRVAELLEWKEGQAHAMPVSSR